MSAEPANHDPRRGAAQSAPRIRDNVSTPGSRTVGRGVYADGRYETEEGR
ncbi:hypothetical protein Nans01_36170 [Nocardiopsis ansamitocini]|uniref:Uncharacterized protein n=1 Tax=Nocardiopsis ansamitocini TaxID=1670832 RepID=A0A9W6P944_9ACTN|nr:hypothetical protein Nans01_36170 [Nocardiopsis ansamitocini]